jgi:hypothetical protein
VGEQQKEMRDEKEKYDEKDNEGGGSPIKDKIISFSSTNPVYACPGEGELRILPVFLQYVHASA